jgi:hypothetical protein
MGARRISDDCRKLDLSVFTPRRMLQCMHSVCIIFDDGRRTGLLVSSNSTVVEGLFGSCLYGNGCRTMCTACVCFPTMVGVQDCMCRPVRQMSKAMKCNQMFA